MTSVSMILAQKQTTQQLQVSWNRQTGASPCWRCTAPPDSEILWGKSRSPGCDQPLPQRSAHWHQGYQGTCVIFVHAHWCLWTANVPTSTCKVGMAKCVPRVMPSPLHWVTRTIALPLGTGKFSRAWLFFSKDSHLSKNDSKTALDKSWQPLLWLMECSKQGKQTHDLTPVLVLWLWLISGIRCSHPSLPPQTLP